MSAVTDLMANLPARSLIPGDPDGITDVIDSLTAWADMLADGYRGMSRIEVSWDGDAARSFKAAYDVQPPRWQAAAKAFDDAVSALTAYRSALIDAQYEAEHARRLFQAGVAASEAAKAAGPGNWSSGPSYQGNFGQMYDPAGAAGRMRAVQMLETARHNLDRAGNRAADALVAAQAAAPEARRWWNAVDDASNQAKAFATIQAIDGLEWAYDNIAVPIVNGLASLGQAAIHHPEDIAKMYFGAMMMVLGAGGEVGGAALDLTVIGAPAGVAINLASAGLIVAGAGIAAEGATSWGKNALDEDVHVLQRLTKQQRLNDPGYAKTPVRSADAGPVTEPGASPYNPLAAGKVPPWGVVGEKTTGSLVSADGTSRIFKSRIDELVEAIAKPRPGRDGVVKSHVESAVGAFMKHNGITEGTLYINRLPCSWATGGCALNLEKMVPLGSKLTIYGPDNFVRVIIGQGVW